MEKRMKRAGHFFTAAALIMGMLFCTACGNRQQAQEGVSYKIYYVNNEETKIVEREYVSATTDGGLLLEELLGQQIGRAHV